MRAFSLTRAVSLMAYVSISGLLFGACDCNPATVRLDGAMDASEDAADAADGEMVCNSDLDCSDSVFCNGTERCLPEDPAADDLGCAPASMVPCAATQICDETADLCTTQCEINPDADGDGVDAIDCGGADCDDSDELINPSATDDDCDGVDEDCSGGADEGFVSAPTSCGTGPCASTGSTSCVSGSVIDSCAPLAGQPTDTTCDAVDDDCNGTADDGYTPTPTTCGVGACNATGSLSCVAGSVVDSCVIGTPAADDLTCDGIDDDCSGAADEDYISLATGCGVGACVSTGTTSCVSGAVQDSCTPTAAAADDATCDGIDDDCSGVADEDYASLATTCGVGACGSTGATSCVSGAVQDSCMIGTPAADDATCDGIDDD